jgi:hypothetical protein
MGQQNMPNKVTDNAVVINMCSSIFAGVASTAITNPIWVLKVRVMSQAPQAKRSCPKDLQRQIYRTRHRYTSDSEQNIHCVAQ